MKTIKIVGVSGIGKTTLIKALLKKILGLSYMSYGEYLERFGAEAGRKWDEDLRSKDGLVLIDDHLEIGGGDLCEIYKKERTRAICVLDAFPEEIMRRIKNDGSRQRVLEKDQIAVNLEKTEKRAAALSRKLGVPLLTLSNLSLEDSMAKVEWLIGVSEQRVPLYEQQEDLMLKLVEFDLEKTWQSHWLINNLRKEIIPLVEKQLEESDSPFDPQDLEHQALFYMTTFDPGKIRYEDITEAVKQQYLIIRKRMLNALSKSEAHYLFRGLKRFYPDLNADHRLKLIWKDNRLVAVGEGREFEVEFRKVEFDDRTIKLFTETLHYIHHGRSKGEVFAFYFKGDRYPWAMETTELSAFSREYKRRALLAHGIHPNRAVELTRMYILPGAPTNAISIMDSLVRNYYKERKLQAIFTCTMPSYSKTKGATISGGLSKVLCVKELKHYFMPKEVDGVLCWEAVTKRQIERDKYIGELKVTHPHFYLLPTIDVYDVITKKTSLKPRPDLESKVIYFNEEDLAS